MDLFGTAAHWFGRGGFVMYLLLLASIGAVSIIIERARYYRRKRQRFHFFIQQWRKDAAVYDVSELAVRYGKSHRVLNRLAAAACHAAENGRSVEIAIESAAQLEAAKLKRGLPLLGCLVTLAPILGLMGTVIGMIQSFSVFNLQSGGAPMAITGGVGEALVATVTGLGVATIALLGHSWFGYRIDIMVTDMEQTGGVLMDDLMMSQEHRGQIHQERGKCKHEAA